jgi:hypothetical protein
MSKQEQAGHKPNQPNKGKEDAHRPEGDTSNITDPQEHMHGPISSAMQSIKEEAEENDEEDREEAEEAAKAGKARDSRGQGE